MSRTAASSPLDLSSLLLSLSLPTSPKRSPELIVMDHLNVRLLETHQEVSLTRDSSYASTTAFVFPDRVVADASPVEIRLVEEGRSGKIGLPVISIDEAAPIDYDDEILRAVFAAPVTGQVCEEKCSCRACQISAGTLPASAMEQGASDAPRRPRTIADMDVREIEYERSGDFLSPDDHSEPTTPNANRSRRPSEKLDYGIDWIEAFKMAPPKQRKSALADEIDGRLSAMDQEEQERELMAETLNKVDQVAKGRMTEAKRSELLFDSSITLKDIFGQSAQSGDVVFNASISLDDVFAGIKTASAHQKTSTMDKYYYHDDDDDVEVLPPEVADLYSSRPSTLPHTSSVNMDDVFAALDRRDRKAPRQNLDDYYADPPSEVFSDSAVSSRQLTDSKATDREREEEEEEGVGDSMTRSSSSGVSHGKSSTPREESSWLTSLVEKRRSVEMTLPSGGEHSSDTDDEPSPPLDPSQLRPAQTPKQTRKESYLLVGELFDHHTPSTPPRVQSIEEEKSVTDLDWINQLADNSTEEILHAVFTCTAVGGEGAKKCACNACDPTRSIYLEREAAAASEERKRSLHLVNPVEITLEEVFEGKKTTSYQPIYRTEETTMSVLPPVDIDLEVVFATPVHSPASRGIDSEKWQPRTLVKEIKQSVVPQARKRSAGHEPPLAPSEIDLGEVFEGNRHHPSTPHNTPIAELDVDVIFAPSSSTTTTSRVNLDKFQPKTLERNYKEPLPVTASYPVIVTDPVDMDAAFSPSKRTAEESGMVSTSTFPVLLQEKEEEEPRKVPEPMVTDSSVHSIIAEEIVTGAMDEALRSPKLEKTEDHGMISNSSFPVFLVDKKQESLPAENVKFGLSSRSSSPEPTTVDLDQVFSGISSEHKPRIDLSKYEQRTLERKKQPTPRPVIITNSSVPVIVADPLDMDQVFNPSPIPPKEDLPTISITNSSVPVIIAEEIVAEAMDEALRSPKLEKTEDHGMISTSSFPVFLVDKKSETSTAENVKFGLSSRSASPEPASVDLDLVFSGVSSEHKPRIDLSKYEGRTLERKTQPSPRPVIITNSSFPVIVADPLDMDQVFNPSPIPPKEDQPTISITNSSVPVIIAEEIVTGAMDEALRSPKLKKNEDQGMISNSSFPVFLVEKKPNSSAGGNVKFGLNSRSASPEPASVDLDLIFSGVSSEHKPRIDLSKYEGRTLERRKEPTPRHVMITNSSVPVIVADPLDMDQVFNPSTSRVEEDQPASYITNSSVPVIIAEEIVSGAMDEALRSPKLEKTEDHGMISNSSFPVFLMDKKPETLASENVKFGINSTSTSPEPSTVDLDQVFSGVSSEHKPRIDLSKYEGRTLERIKEPAPRPVMITNSSVPVIVADPLDMDQVFNPSPIPPKTDESSAPAVVADAVVQRALEESSIDLDQVFSGPSTDSAPRVDLSKFEIRTLERRRDTPRPVMVTPSSFPVLVADPLDMNLVFAPAKKVEEEIEEKESHPAAPEPVDSAPLDAVTDSIAEVIATEAIDDALRSPELKESCSAFSFCIPEQVGSFAAIDSATSLDTLSEQVVYPRTITHVRASAPEFTARENDVADESPLKVVEEEDEDDEDEEMPLPVFARSRNPAYGMSSDRPRVTQSEDGPVHYADPISVVTDLPSTSSQKKVISPEPSKERTEVPAATIDLDEVFAAPMSPSTSQTSRIDLDKFMARTLERRDAPVRVIAPQPETREHRHSDLPTSAISVDDIFSPQPAPSAEAIAAPAKPPRAMQQSESASTDPMDDPATEVDLDSVFATSFGSEGKPDQSRLAPRSVDRTLTAEFNNRREAAVSTLSTLPSSDTDMLTPAPVPPPRRSPRPSASDAPGETPPPPQQQKLISVSSFPILIADEGDASDAPTAPPRRRGPSPAPPGVIIEQQPSTPPPSLATTPTPPARTHRRTDSISLPRSRHASYNRISESITEESTLTVDAIFSTTTTDTARPSVTVTERGTEATVDIVLPPPRAPPKMSFPPPPPVEEIEYETVPLRMTSSTIEEDVKEARLMASPDFPPLSVVTAPVEIDMDAVFEHKILTPSRFDTDRWQPRTLEREKKRTVEEVVEKREKSDLPESTVDIDEIFSGRLTTTDVEYVTSQTRFSLKKSEEKKENWEDELSQEIEEYEKRRNRLGQETDGSVRSTISCASSIPFSSTPDGTWRRNESLRSAQEPVVALIEKEKKRKESTASEKSGKSAKRKGSRGSWKVEHVLEPQSDGLIETSSNLESGPKVEAREAKRNGKVWRVDRVQKTASSIEDSEEEKGVKIQVHSIPAPLTVSMDSIDDIERSIDDAFDEALSPRSRVIEIRRIPSSSVVLADVHRHDELESETYPHPEYTTETIKGQDGVYRSVTSLPSTSDSTKIVFPLTSPVEEQRYVTSASIRLEKSLPPTETTLERNRLRHTTQLDTDPSDLRWVPSPVPVERVTMRKRSRSEGPLGLLEDVVMEGPDSADIRNYRMSWHPSSVKADLEDRGYRGLDERINGSLTTTVRVAGYSSPKSGRSREARERRKKIIRKSRHSVSSSTSTGESSSTRPDEEEMLEVEVTKRHIVLRGSYNLVVSKDEPLGILLLSLSDGQPIVPAALDFSVLPKLRRLLRECMTRRARSVSMLSSRGASLLDIACPSNENIRTVASDLFHPINNPRGKVNLCTAENRVCAAEVSKKLEEIRFHPDTHRWMMRYAGSGGINETKLSLISHFSSLLSVSIDEEEALLLPSCTAAYDVLSHLCCDPQDVILTPAPYYARIRNDCAERNECRVEPVVLDMDKPELFVSDFEREYTTWASKGERVRAIIIVNPHNPLGNIWSRHQMMSVCEWAISNDVFIIVDEILSGTIYTDKNLSEFPSMLGLKNELSKPEQLVWMGSLSKDLGLPGIKTALVVAASPAIREAVRRMENLGSVPAPSQLIVNQLVADKIWLSSTLSSSRRRLASHARFVVQSLEDIAVPCVIPKGGICLMADFSKFMPTVSSVEEKALHRRLIEHGVVLVKGESTVAPEPGWFRISFGVPKEELELGLRRIYSTVARDATMKRTVNYGEETNRIKKEWLVSEVRSTSPGTTVESA